MPRKALPRACSTAAALFVLAAATGCKPGSDAPTPEPVAPSAATAPAEPAAPAVASIPCALTAFEEGISNFQLQSEDGDCRLFLPATVTPGEYPVRISAAGDPTAAAVEARTGDGPLYATEGTVVITVADANRVSGRLSARDGVEPVQGVIETTFDVSLAP
jgi:hypothetical protein